MGTETDFDLKRFMDMDEAEAEAMVADMQGRGPEQPADQGEGAAEEPPAEDDAAAQPSAEEPEEGAEQGTPGGQVKQVPHGALHEERQRRKLAEQKATELEQRLAAIEQRMSQPAAGQQPQNQQGNPEAEAAAELPELLVEDPAAVDARVAQALAPYQGMLAEYQQLKAAAVEQQEIARIGEAYGDPNAAAVLARFDANAPGVKAAGLPVPMRYLMARGIQAVDPEEQAAMAAQTAQAAKAMAVEQKAKELSQKASPATPNLAGVPPAAPNGASDDLAGMSAKDLLELDEAKLARYERGDFR